ncbi:hypothetical protein DVR12_21360 [Chitinophaga silvatica]|uniref:Galactose oxidase n=1 Tax=Chitinophaga silvatica TaxID=2282649 RepID=A0A3E1Y4N1_9BACT|nr:hypothetical protein [Chitinophaga silvatica]RFS19655.1 hypothetical protein DVR12_21360 [Chitinophaga silvatica]
MLRHAVLLLTLLLLSVNHCKAQEVYGLEFASKDISQEDRTSLDLFPNKPLSVKDAYSLSFDLSFQPFFKSNFGYIVRIIDETDQNIDLIYNMHKQAFDLVTGNTFSGISFKRPKDSLFHHWNNITLDFDIQTHSIALRINKQLIGRINSQIVKGTAISISFGASYRRNFKSFDLPPMRIKDIRIRKNGTLKYHWPLNELQGTIAYDKIARQAAAVKNPMWMKAASNNWELTDSMKINGYAAIAMDPQTETIYITSPDSIYQFTPHKRTIYSQTLQTPQYTPAGARAVFDPIKQQLVHVFLQNKHQTSNYDSSTKSWNKPFENNAVTTYWHSSIFFSPFDSAIYTFGGYGDFNYKNEVHRFVPNSDQWEKLKTSGDTFIPRYLSAAGLNKAGDSAYLLGGYGSITGDQLLNPHPLYDLMVYDLKRRTFKTIYKITPPEEPFVFANNLVVNTDKQEYYALSFPNDRMRSSLQLVRGSLKEPIFTTIAAPLPYKYYDIKSSAYLFYCPQNDKLICVTTYCPDEKSTIIKVHSILFSPYGLAVPMEDPLFPNYVIRLFWALAIGFGIFLLLTAISVIHKKRAKAVVTPIHIPISITDKEPIRPPVKIDILPGTQVNCRLFGSFNVTDQEKNDITKSFTPLLKELFLLLYLHTEIGNTGISSEKINEILWPGRAAKDAKNNRSVNIVKLRSLLDKIGSYNLCKENERWFLHLESITTDLKEYQQFINNKSNFMSLALLLNKGGFLPEIEYQWLDKFKATVASDSINELFSHLQDPGLSPEEAIIICDGILQSDTLYEEAIYHKCKALISMRQHASAKKVYTDFTKAYEQLYGETFEKPYSEVIDQSIAAP